jgi:hypothetical protein
MIKVDIKNQNDKYLWIDGVLFSRLLQREERHLDTAPVAIAYFLPKSLTPA